jgi:hypothetical protein
MSHYGINESQDSDDEKRAPMLLDQSKEELVETH